LNSRSKGARGERGWRDELRANGYLKAYRSAQYSGKGPDSADVQCPELPGIHFEVKFVEKLNLRDAYAQAKRECGTKMPVVAHRRNHSEWLVTMSSDDFFKLIRGLD
jgi:hypothetical protein